MKPFILFLPFIIFFIGCTTSTGNVNYSNYNVYESNATRKVIGVVHSSKRSFFWTSCSDLSQEIILDLSSQAAAMGGGMITNVKFVGENDTRVQVPTCSTGWGWFILYFIPQFGPWVQVASAEASVVPKEVTNQSNIKVENGSKTEELEKEPSRCASLVIGDAQKLVCGDSKDRVIEKWGNPSNQSPSLNNWTYKSCYLEFKYGRLNNYGGKCDLTKISNDSFIGDRVVK